MTTYITQEQILAIGKSVLNKVDAYDDGIGFAREIEAAAIQAYRDSLVAGELPEPVANAVHKGELVYTADQLRQAIADALAKQDVRAPMFKFRECEDSQAMQEPDYEQSETYLRTQSELAKQVQGIFAAQVAAGKWKALNDAGYTANYVYFSKDGRAGQIDPYGRVTWSEDDALAKQVPQWLPIETAPTSEDAPFMVFVPRDSIGDGVAVQVSMFEGRLYPDGKDSCIDWDDAITSATHWATRLENPITKAAK